MKISIKQSTQSKFKVGDWIRDGEDIYQFIEPSSIYSYESSLQRCELWQPKIGEWCWFLNKGKAPVLMQFLSIETDGNRKYSATFPNTPHPMIAYYDYCEPFLGKLPTKLQEALC